jgi:hypothetical protein
MRQACISLCGKTGCVSFVTAVGVGFIAYASTHIYMCFCAPTGFWGFLQSLVVMDSTFCQMLMGLIHHTQNLYGAMMIAFLFSFVAAIGQGVHWITGEKVPEITDTIQPRAIKRR